MPKHVRQQKVKTTHEKERARKRADARARRLTPEQVAAAEERAARDHLVLVQTGLLALLVLALLEPAVVAALFHPAAAAASASYAAATLCFLPALAAAIFSRSTPAAQLTAVWAAWSCALALVVAATPLFGMRANAAKAVLLLLRLVAAADCLPAAARGVWRLLRGVDDEELKPVSVRRTRPSR